MCVCVCVYGIVRTGESYSFEILNISMKKVNKLLLLHNNKEVVETKKMRWGSSLKFMLQQGNWEWFWKIHLFQEEDRPLCIKYVIHPS